MKKRKKPSADDQLRELASYAKIIDQLGIVMNRVGISGFITICFVIWVFAFTSKPEKSEITDTWILLKTDNWKTFACIIILFLLLFLIVQMYYCYKMMQNKDREIARISEEKSKLQELISNSNLSSSKK